MLGFSLAGVAGAMEDSGCRLPSVDGFGDALDTCARPVQVTAYQTRQVNVSPVDVDFGAVKVGALIKVPVTLNNLTNLPLALAGGGFNDPGAFTNAAGSTCGNSGAAGASCNSNCSFTPAAVGPTTASTSIGMNASLFYMQPGLTC